MATLTASGINFSDGTIQNSAGTTSNAAAGYVKLPSGIIIQWGRTAQTGGSNGSGAYLTSSYPIAFPNACWQISGVAYAPTELNNALSNNVVSYTNSTFVIVTQRYGGSNPRAQFSWIAIGY